jgi:hypothetical protein
VEATLVSRVRHLEAALHQKGTSPPAAALPGMPSPVLVPAPQLVHTAAAAEGVVTAPGGHAGPAVSTMRGEEGIDTVIHVHASSAQLVAAGHITSGPGYASTHAAEHVFTSLDASIPAPLPSPLPSSVPVATPPTPQAQGAVAGPLGGSTTGSPGSAAVQRLSNASRGIGELRAAARIVKTSPKLAKFR